MARFEGTIRKTYAGYKWVNSYRFEAVDIQAADQALNVFRSFEQGLLYSQVTIDQQRIAGWRSSDPNDFITTPLNFPGSLSSAGQPLATPQSCLHIQFASVSGRPGRRFYRYCLTQEEIFGIGDEMRLSVAAARLTAISDALADAFNELSLTGATFVIGDWPAVGPPRTASSGVVQGAANVDIHHGWFNRSVGA